MPHDPNIIGPGDPRGSKFLSSRQRKGIHKRSGTGGTAEQMYGTLGHNLKPYRTASKLRQIYAYTMFLSGIEGEEDPADFWELVETLREKGVMINDAGYPITNQFIWDNWIGDPSSYRQIQSMIQSMEEGTGLEVIANEVRSLRAGQTVISGAAVLSPEDLEERAKAIEVLRSKGRISQRRYLELKAEVERAGTQSREFTINVDRKRFPDDPTGSEDVWSPSGPDRGNV